MKLMGFNVGEEDLVVGASVLHYMLGELHVPWKGDDRRQSLTVCNCLLQQRLIIKNQIHMQ